jgi:hypothetical protein
MHLCLASQQQQLQCQHCFVCHVTAGVMHCWSSFPRTLCIIFAIHHQLHSICEDCQLSRCL